MFDLTGLSAVYFLDEGTSRRRAHLLFFNQDLSDTEIISDRFPLSQFTSVLVLTDF